MSNDTLLNIKSDCSALRDKNANNYYHLLNYLSNNMTIHLPIKMFDLRYYGVS